jgi:hypothetical protein
VLAVAVLEFAIAVIEVALEASESSRAGGHRRLILLLLVADSVLPFTVASVQVSA